MPIETRMLGRVDYAATVQSMQDYTATRTPDSPDLLLICEHLPLWNSYSYNLFTENSIVEQ